MRRGIDRIVQTNKQESLHEHRSGHFQPGHTRLCRLKPALVIEPNARCFLAATYSALARCLPHNKWRGLQFIFLHFFYQQAHPNKPIVAAL